MFTNVTDGVNSFVVTDFYYFDDKGEMLTGWLTDGTGAKYFLDTDAASIGKMTRGWKSVNNVYYYFKDDGKLMLGGGVTPDGYTVDANGVWVQ